MLLRRVAYWSQEKANGHINKEEKRPLNGKAHREAVPGSAPKTRPYVLYAILIMLLLGAAAALVSFAMGGSSVAQHHVNLMCTRGFEESADAWPCMQHSWHE